MRILTVYRKLSVLERRRGSTVFIYFSIFYLFHGLNKFRW